MKLVVLKYYKTWARARVVTGETRLAAFLDILGRYFLINDLLLDGFLLLHLFDNLLLHLFLLDFFLNLLFEVVSLVFQLVVLLFNLLELLLNLLAISAWRAGLGLRTLLALWAGLRRGAGLARLLRGGRRARRRFWARLWRGRGWARLS